MLWILLLSLSFITHSIITILLPFAVFVQAEGEEGSGEPGE